MRFEIVFQYPALIYMKKVLISGDDILVIGIVIIVVIVMKYLAGGRVDEYRASVRAHSGRRSVRSLQQD